MLSWLVNKYVQFVNERASVQMTAASSLFIAILDGCIAWNAHNTIFDSKGLAICAQAVYFLHSTRPVSLDLIVDSDRRKFWEVSCTECTGQGMTLN